MSSRRILVCDDEPLIRMWLVSELRKWGYVAEGVADGVSLLAALEGEPADLVLLDVRLPDASGVSLLPRIRSMDPAPPVILITAYGDPQTVATALERGAYRVLEKPVAGETLAAVVTAALETDG